MSADQIADVLRNLIRLYPEGRPHRADLLDSLALLLYNRFCKIGEMSNLDEALVLNQEVLSLRPKGHPQRAQTLSTIAVYFHARFNQLGKLSDLDEALSNQRSALELFPEGHPDRLAALINYASHLNSHFMRFGMLSDLDEAITLQRSALDSLQEGHSLRNVSLGNLAACLFTRFDQTGVLADLDEALVLQRSALSLCPDGHPGRPVALVNLANYLNFRFSQLGMLSDLDEAIFLQRSALDLFPEGRILRAIGFDNLARYLHTRFKKLGNLSDMDESLSLQRTALDSLPEGHPHRDVSLGNLASYLCTRFVEHGIFSDLDEALALQRCALELRPQGHPDRDVALDKVAYVLETRFNKLGLQSDLDEAIILERSALELRPKGHPDRVSSLSSLAHRLHVRFECSNTCNEKDFEEAFELYSQLSDLSYTVALGDLGNVKMWIAAAEVYGHTTTILAYQTFLRLCVHHLAYLSTLPQHLSLLKQLMGSTAMDAFSACIRHDNHVNAAELVEHGRGVFWSQLLHLRSPLDDVIASGEAGRDLANKFTQLASSLCNVPDFVPKAEHERAWHLQIRLQGIVAEIRKLPGLARFLQAPLFSELRVAALHGPVIIVNASQYSCDALIVLSNQEPVHVTLPATKDRMTGLASELGSLLVRAKLGDVSRELMAFLRELWDVAVFPIVKVLEKSCLRRSRIWWCPTAEFSLLPLHAAGPFRKGQPNLSSRYISSYTPTLTALVRARSQTSQNVPMDKPRFLLVGQTKALGQNKLVSVNTELSNISKHIGPAATLSRIQDEEATIDNVARELGRSQFVHFACHGIPNRKQPFESGFALGDGRLKVENIMRYDLLDAHFAYLSACHTTVGDEGSPDEVIHLAAAMQFAGFRSVIGTMWAVDDAYASEIAPAFYGHMLDRSGRFDYTRAARALHKTIKSVSREIPLDQRVLYVHIGI